MKKAKMKRPILGLKKDEIVTIISESDSYCLCQHEKSQIRIEKRHLEFLKK